MRCYLLIDLPDEYRFSHGSETKGFPNHYTPNVESLVQFLLEVEYVETVAKTHGTAFDVVALLNIPTDAYGEVNRVTLELKNSIREKFRPSYIFFLPVYNYQEGRATVQQLSTSVKKMNSQEVTNENDQKYDSG